MDNPIEPGAQGFLIGYPAWKWWNLQDVNSQAVLNRTSPHAGMNSFTITGAGSIRPGNSGGPFTDDRFRIAGMAQCGVHMGVGHDESLCIVIIDELIATYKASLVSAAVLAPSVGALAPALSAMAVPAIAPIAPPPVPGALAAGAPAPSVPASATSSAPVPAPVTPAVPPPPPPVGP